MTQALDRLTRLADKLLGPDGCPWDKAQTPTSLSGYLIEEAAESAQAIMEEGPEAVREELGDLLYLIVFICRLYQDQGLFGLDQVAQAAEAKMVHRHPHVFGDDSWGTPKEVKDNWDKNKLKEKDPSVSLLDSVPKSLPGLLRAHRLSQRASTVGFDWTSPEAVFKKVEEEMGELKSALSNGSGSEKIAEELGDLFFSLANLSRHLGHNPENVIQQANSKFTDRFKDLESAFKNQGRGPSEAGPGELDSIWEEVKRRR